MISERRDDDGARKYFEPKSKSIKTFLLKIIGLIIICLILSRINIDSILSRLAEVNAFYFGVAMLVFPLLILVKSYRLWLILKRPRLKRDIKSLFLINMASFSAGTLTPGRVGEFIKVFYLCEMGHTLGKSLFCTILDRLLDILFIMVVSCVGVIIMFKTLRFEVALVFALLMLGAFIVVSIYYVDRSQVWRRKVKEWMSITLKIPYLDRMKLYMNVIRQEIRDIQLPVLCYALILTVLFWVLYYVQLYLLILSLHIDLSFIDTSIFISITSLVSVLPITFMGIGTRDAALIYLFGLNGISEESAVAFSTLILTLILINAGCGAFAFLRFSPKVKVGGKDVEIIMKQGNNRIDK